YFKIKRLDISNHSYKESYSFESFIIYFCTNGECIVKGGGVSEILKKGENILIPAGMGEYSIEGKCTLLEITGKE
ncbi:MAG: hypothetical protein U1D64_05485, partial [Bacteroidales bacterium]|nr:hypothetical protein [Bacteroidales bacterium]